MLVPLLHNIAASVALAGVSDCLTQRLERQHRARRIPSGDATVPPTNSTSSNNKTDANADGGGGGQSAAANPPQEQPYDAVRTLRFMLAFGVWGGALSSVWYESLLPALVPGKEVIALDVADNLGNVVLVAANLGMSGALECKGWRHVATRLRQDYLPSLAVCVGIYVPVDLLMFTVVPVGLQVVFVKSVGVVLNVASSFFANRQIVACPGKPQLAAGEEDSSITSTTTVVWEDDADGAEVVKPAEFVGTPPSRGNSNSNKQRAHPSFGGGDENELERGKRELTEEDAREAATPATPPSC